MVGREKREKERKGGERKKCAGSGERRVKRGRGEILGEEEEREDRRVKRGEKRGGEDAPLFLTSSTNK